MQTCGYETISANHFHSRARCDQIGWRDQNLVDSRPISIIGPLPKNVGAVQGLENKGLYMKARLARYGDHSPADRKSRSLDPALQKPESHA